jgi:hypothetical protein
MKRKLSVIFYLMTLFSGVFVASIGMANAFKPDEVQIGTLANPVTINGQWSPGSEWEDAAQANMAGGLNGIFRDKLDMSAFMSGGSIMEFFLVDIVGDTTDNAADSAIICFTAPATFGGVPTGGTAPQTDCVKFEINGTGASLTLTIYRGTGTGWALLTGWTAAQCSAASAITASPMSGTPHRVVEITWDQQYFNFAPEFYGLVAAYDASQPGLGVQTWPSASSPDVPNDYGHIAFVSSTVPEGIGLAVMLSLSSIAAIIGARYFRKQPKIKK